MGPTQPPVHTMGTGSLQELSGRSVALTTYPHLGPRLIMNTTKSLLPSVPPKAGYGVTFTFTEECIECFCGNQRYWTVSLKEEFWEFKRN